jgi:hypothetical protein
MKQVINKIPIFNDFFIVLSSPVDKKEFKTKLKLEENRSDENTDKYSIDVFNLITNRLIGESLFGKNKITNSRITSPSF